MIIDDSFRPLLILYAGDEERRRKKDRERDRELVMYLGGLLRSRVRLCVGACLCVCV